MGLYVDKYSIAMLPADLTEAIMPFSANEYDILILILSAAKWKSGMDVPNQYTISQKQYAFLKNYKSKNTAHKYLKQMAENKILTDECCRFVEEYGMGRTFNVFESVEYQDNMLKVSLSDAFINYLIDARDSKKKYVQINVLTFFKLQNAHTKKLYLIWHNNLINKERVYKNWTLFKKQIGVSDSTRPHELVEVLTKASEQIAVNADLIVPMSGFSLTKNRKRGFYTFSFNVIKKENMRL